MAHFYPGTLLEISCYHIYPLTSSPLYSLIFSFHSRHSFVQSAVFTIGDPVFLFSFHLIFSLYVLLFLCCIYLSISLFIAGPACFKILVFYHRHLTHPFHPNFHSIFLWSKEFWLRLVSMSYVLNDNVVIAVVTWHISAKFLFWGGGGLWEGKRLTYMRSVTFCSWGVRAPFDGQL